MENKIKEEKMSIIANIVAIILIVFARNRNKLIMSVVSSIILTIVLSFSYVDEINFITIVLLLILEFVCCFVSYTISDKLDPDSIILYIIYWEIFYSVAFFLLRVITMPLLG